MINLQKVLDEQQSARKEEANSFGAISEMKELMAYTAGKEREVLRGFGLDENIRKVEDANGRMIESVKFCEEYGNSYDIKDIGKIARDFRLRFLPLSSFKGGIDSLLASKIVAFGEKHGIDPVRYADNFYVLGPHEDFRMSETKHRRPRPIVAQDPLLFYRTDKVGEHWTLIHKWGTEFNYLRFIKSFRYRNDECYIAHTSVVLWCVYMLLSTLLFGGFTLSMIEIAAVCAVLAVVSAFVILSTFDDAKCNNMFTEKNWTDRSYHKTVNWDE